MKKLNNFNYDPVKTIWTLIITIAILTMALAVTQANLNEERKQVIAQGSFCIKNTADVTANYQLALIREKDAHQRDVDDANTKLEFLVNEYNKLLNQAKKGQSIKQDVLSLYSYLIHPRIS